MGMKPPRVSGRRKAIVVFGILETKPDLIGGKEEGKFFSAPFRPQRVDKSRFGVRNGSKWKELEGPFAAPPRMIALRLRLVERRRRLLSVDAEWSYAFTETAQLVAFAEAVAAVRRPSADRGRVEGRRSEAGRWAFGASPGNCAASLWKHSISAENGMRPDRCGRKRPERTAGSGAVGIARRTISLLDELVQAAARPEKSSQTVEKVRFGNEYGAMSVIHARAPRHRL
jgi:hypothetical protein